MKSLDWSFPGLLCVRKGSAVKPPLFLTAHQQNRLLKKEDTKLNTTLRTVSVRRLHRLSVQFKPESRGRLFVHKVAPPTQALITHDTLLLDSTHQPLLAVADPSATETHWKAPGTGPMHCSLCMLLSHDAPLPHSYIHRP